VSLARELADVHTDASLRWHVFDHGSDSIAGDMLYGDAPNQPWLLLPAALSLAIFAWLLTLHPAAAGRVYAAYGGVYVAVALVWLWKVERIPLTHWDLVGAAVTIAGMGIIVWGGWRV
jgi:drug/metabolite transporter superfamily protein YnfA